MSGEQVKRGRVIILYLDFNRPYGREIKKILGNDIDVGPNPAGLMRTFSSAKPITRIVLNIFRDTQFDLS